MIQIPADRLSNLAQAIFQFGGSSEVEANQVAERLIEANLFGHDSHGVGMVPAYMEGIKSGELKPGNDLTIERDHGSFLLVNGNAGFGQIIANRTMKLAIARAQELGVSVVGLKNSYPVSYTHLRAHET